MASFMESPAKASGKIGSFRASFSLSAPASNEETTDKVVVCEQGHMKMSKRTPLRSSCMHLTWASPPQNLLIVAKPHSQAASEGVYIIVKWLRATYPNLGLVMDPVALASLTSLGFVDVGIQSWTKENEVKQLLASIDLVVTVGGDGTVLFAASLFPAAPPPFVCFACGTLGFMTPFDVEKHAEILKVAIEGPLCIMLRQRIEARISVKNKDECHGTVLEGERGDLKALDSKCDPSGVVLNEVVVSRGMTSNLVHLNCFCDGTEMTTVHGDGLILSTPSGSTAYSLAAGGSMVHPQVPGILVTPICPHTLSFRPLVLPETSAIQVQVHQQSHAPAFVSFDGRDGRKLMPGDAVHVELSCWPLAMACSDNPSCEYIRLVKDKLSWNEQRMNRL